MSLSRLAEIDGIIFRGHGFFFRNVEDGFIGSLTLLQSHSFRHSGPHGLLPGKEILFHGASAIVTFTGRSNALGAELGEQRVDVPNHSIVVLIGVVTQAEDDIFEGGQGTVVGGGTTLKGYIITRDELIELHGVVGGFTFAVGGHDKECDLILRELVEIVVIEILHIGDHGLQAEALRAFLGQSRGIVLGSSSLRAIENHTVLAGFLHLLNNVPGFLGFRGAIGRGERRGIGVFRDSPVGTLGEVGNATDQESHQDDEVEGIQFGHGGREQVG